MQNLKKKTIFIIIMGIPYRVIICRYNEINLKSESYADMLIKILKKAITNICKREGITSQGIQLYHSRLFCFFPSDQILHAFTIIRQIPGIHSLTLALSMKKKLPVFSNELHNYLLNTFPQQKWAFSIKMRQKHQKNAVTEKEVKLVLISILNQIHNENPHPNKTILKVLQMDGKKCKNPTLHIEFLQKGAYLYHKFITGLWGGMPIESKNSMCVLFNEESLFASYFLMRRGTLVIPLLFSNNKKETNYLTELEKTQLNRLAKYYSAPLPIIKFNTSSIPEHCVTPTLLKNIKKIMEQTQRKALFQFNERNVHLRAIILESDPSLITISQKEQLLYFTPLEGISLKTMNTLRDGLKHISHEFSFHDTIVKGVSNNATTKTIEEISNKDEKNNKKCSDFNLPYQIFYANGTFENKI